MNDQEPAPGGGRACKGCAEPIPAERRSNAKYCSKECQVRSQNKDTWASSDKEANREYMRSYYYANLEKERESRKRSGQKLNAKIAGEMRRGSDFGILAYKRRMLSGARSRAKAKGLPFNLSVDDVHIPDVCPVLGIEIKFSFGQPSDNSPSLDKIVPAFGYTKNNVEVISHRANTLKRDSTVQEMRAIADYYEQKLSKNWMVPNANE